jgi:hypothetical protein
MTAFAHMSLEASLPPPCIELAPAAEAGWMAGNGGAGNGDGSAMQIHAACLCR